MVLRRGPGGTGRALRAPGLCSFPLPSVPRAQVPARLLLGAQPLSWPGWGPVSQEGRGGCGRSRNGNGRVAGSRPRALTRGRSLPHSQRKQARELLAALQKVVVPIYCTSFLAVEEDKQQKIARVRGTVPQAEEQLSPSATTTEPVCRGPTLGTRQASTTRNLTLQGRAALTHRNLRKPCTAAKSQRSQK